MSDASCPRAGLIGWVRRMLRSLKFLSPRISFRSNQLLMIGYSSNWTQLYTTGASLRAGIPTIIKPFFGDQWFYGQRVEDLGVGICLKKVNTSVLARALWEATNSSRL